jgi:hypothetical protein
MFSLLLSSVIFDLRTRHELQIEIESLRYQINVIRRSPYHQSRKLWAAFLRNHREAITAMDFFTVPTLTFRVP